MSAAAQCARDTSARRTGAHTAYAEMVAEAARTGLPQTFATDLTTHDRAFVARAPEGAAFFWCLYQHGTFLAAISPSLIDSHHFVWDMPRICSGLGSVECPSRLYVWDGRALRDYADVDECSAAIRRVACPERPEEAP